MHHSITSITCTSQIVAQSLSPGHEVCTKLNGGGMLMLMMQSRCEGCLTTMW